MSWFKRLVPQSIRFGSDSDDKKGVPEGIWTKCTSCSAPLYQRELAKQLNVCPKCGHHMYIAARTRLMAFLDEDDFVEIAPKLEPQDILKFRDSKKYKDRISQAQKNTKEKDALLAFSGKLGGAPVVAAAFEYKFMGGSMGAVVGQKFVAAVNKSLELQCPLVCFAASGGARMQEGLTSLMQMAKTSAALNHLTQAGLPFISVLTHPTTGGVSASLALLGDVIIAEPRALIGFAGPRVIEQTVREVLPDGFQRSEFLVEHGAIDMVYPRAELRERIADLLAKLMYHRQQRVS